MHEWRRVSYQGNMIQFSDTPPGTEAQQLLSSDDFSRVRELRDWRRVLHSWVVPYHQLLGSNDYPQILVVR
jgi:hypothetical protein